MSEKGRKEEQRKYGPFVITEFDKRKKAYRLLDRGGKLQKIQVPRKDLEVVEFADPRAKEDSEHKHAEWTSLWDATWFGVWLAEALWESVVVDGVFVEIAIGGENLGGKTHGVKNEIKERSKKLIKTFEDVKHQAEEGRVEKH